MKPEMKNILVMGGVLAVAVIILAVSLSYNPVVNRSTGGTFNSVEDIRDFLESHTSQGVYAYGGGIRTFAAQDSFATAEAAPSTDSAKSVNGAGASDYSQTNVQVEGVDEPDVVKNDGKYIYTISGNKVVIVEAYPADEMKIVDEIKFDDESVMNLFVNGDKLIVFTQKYEYVDTGLKCGGEFYWGVRCGGYSRESALVYVYDISDRSDAKLDKEISLNGNYVDARMTGNYVYLISSKYIYSNGFELPYYSIDGETTKIAPGEIRYFDQDDENFVFNTIAAIDVDSGDFESETYLMGASTSVYVSADNIYLTYQKQLSQEYILGRYLDEVLLPELPREFASRVEEVWNNDDYTLNEKQRRIGDIFEEFGPNSDGYVEFQQRLEEKAFEFFKKIQKEQEKTVIHRIAFDGLSISYEAQGEVPGRVLNQFSMDEFDGTFRIATTTGGWDRDANENNLYVLDSDLEEVGKLEGLAEGEQIYSARFIGERAYLVTFRQTDPLFAIDLSDPSHPKVLGELKVTGYSGYLHPYDENHLLGIGMEASEDGRVEGVKISLFDVSDNENPVEVGKYEVDEKWSNSEATYDHKAVLFDKEKKLLVIPISYSKERKVAGDSWPRYENWQGAYVFNVDLDGISLKGKIAHESNDSGDQYWYGGGDYVRRSLYIDSVLYTVSNSKIKANALSDLNFVGEVKLPFEYGGPILYGAKGSDVAVAID